MRSNEVLQPDNLVFRMLPYLFTQRDVHSTTVKESLKPHMELGTQTHDALRPACPTSSGVLHYCIYYIHV
jgi:hypothetical protein